MFLFALPTVVIILSKTISVQLGKYRILFSASTAMALCVRGTTGTVVYLLPNRTPKKADTQSVMGWASVFFLKHVYIIPRAENDIPAHGQRYYHCRR